MEDFKRAPWQDQLLLIEPFKVDTPSVHPIDLAIGLSASKKKWLHLSGMFWHRELRGFENVHALQWMSIVQVSAVE